MGQEIKCREKSVGKSTKQIGTALWRPLNSELWPCGDNTRCSCVPTLQLHSLVPRPSHRPVFDHLQYAKTEVGRPGPFYHVNDVSVYLGRQRGGRGPQSHFAHAFFVLNQEQYVFAS